MSTTARPPFKTSGKQLMAAVMAEMEAAARDGTWQEVTCGPCWGSARLYTVPNPTPGTATPANGGDIGVFIGRLICDCCSYPKTCPHRRDTATAEGTQ
jgi:hypothetical protein